MLKLYYAPGTCALASHIALEEAGATYETVRLSFKNEDQKKPDYLKINPKARVPSLVTDRGILTETPAILIYIAQTYPAAGSRRSTIRWRSPRCRRSTAICARPCTSRMRTACAATAGPTIRRRSMRCRRRCRSRSANASTLIEREMFKGPWVIGETYTICDPYLFTIAQWLGGDGVDINKTPKIADHFKRVGERPAVQRALAEEKRELQSAA